MLAYTVSLSREASSLNICSTKHPVCGRQTIYADISFTIPKLMSLIITDVSKSSS